MDHEGKYQLTFLQLKKQYVSETVLKSEPWTAEAKEGLDHLLARILFLYRRVATAGDEDLAKDQLRSQLREKVVIDRETVWSQMVSGHNKNTGIFRSVTPDVVVSSFEPDKQLVNTPFGRFRRPDWLSGRAVILALAFVVLVVLIQVQPFDRVEESNCLAMLVFCTILWATEVGTTILLVASRR